jgi:hypothetical protein
VQDFCLHLPKRQTLLSFYRHDKNLCQAEQSLESAVADERVTRAIERTEQVFLNSV